MVSEVLQSIPVLFSGLMHPGHCLDLERNTRMMRVPPSLEQGRRLPPPHQTADSQLGGGPHYDSSSCDTSLYSN